MKQNLIHTILICILCFLSIMINSCGNSTTNSNNLIDSPVTILYSGSHNLTPGESVTFTASLSASNIKNKKMHAILSSDQSYQATVQIINSQNGLISVTPVSFILSPSNLMQVITLNVANTAVITNPTNNIQIVINIPGYLASNPIEFNIVNPGSINFEQSELSMTTGQTKNVILSMTAPGQDATVILSTSSSNISLDRNQCTFSVSNRICNIKVTASSVTGDYDINATSSIVGQSITPLSVQVYTPGTIAFTDRIINLSPNSTEIATLQLNGATAEMGNITVTLTPTSTNISLNQQKCILNVEQNTCAINISSNSITGNYQVIATATGMDISPLEINVDTIGTITFEQDNVTISAGESTNILMLLNGANSGSAPITVALQSNNDNLTESPSSCTLSSIQPSCLIKITANIIPGDYQILATASNGQNINPLNVQVNPNNYISFDTNSIIMSTNSIQAIRVSLSGAKGNTQPVTVTFTDDTGNLVITPTSCILSIKDIDCTIIVASNMVTGNYQISASAIGYDINPVDVQVISPGMVAFNPTSLNVLTNHSVVATVELVGATSSTAPVTVNLNSSSEHLIVSPNNCLLKSDNTSCAITVTADDIDGNYQILATANGDAIDPLDVFVDAVGTISFNNENINIEAGKTQSLILTMNGPSVSTPSATVTLASTSPQNLTVTPTTCILSPQSPNCTVNAKAGNTVSTSEIQITASSTDYNITPVNVNITSAAGAISFKSPINMLTNQTQNVVLELTGSAGVTSVPVTLTLSKNANITLNKTQCNLSSADTTCTIAVTSNSVAGSYSISAKATGYKINDEKINVEVPGTISFTPASADILANQSFTTTLQLNNRPKSQQQVKVNFSSTSSSLTLGSSTCTLPNGLLKNNWTCDLKITAGATNGQFLVNAQADGYTIDPFTLNVQPSGIISFDQTSQTVAIGSTDKVILRATGTITPTVITFSKSPFNLITKFVSINGEAPTNQTNPTCTISNNSPECIVEYLVTSLTFGTVQLSANSSKGIAITPVTITIIPPIIFLTQNNYSGNLGGIAGADAICNQEATTQGFLSSSNGFKAMLADNDRYPCITSTCINESKDWVLQANRTYNNSSNQPIFTTNANGIGTFPATAPINTVSVNVWTGLLSNWVWLTGNLTCNSWTGVGSQSNGIIGQSNSLNNSMISSFIATCTQPQRLYCVMQ